MIARLTDNFGRLLGDAGDSACFGELPMLAEPELALLRQHLTGPVAAPMRAGNDAARRPHTYFFLSPLFLIQPSHRTNTGRIWRM
jgi:hypothetical protein